MSATWLRKSCGVKVRDTSSNRSARCSRTAVPIVPSAPVTRTRCAPMACSVPRSGQAGTCHARPVPTPPLGATYDPGAFYDEMFSATGTPRPHYRALAAELGRLSFEEFEERRHAVELSFVNQGIAFTVYGRGGGDRADLPVRPDPARDSRRGVGPARARPDPAGARAQPLPARHLPRAANPPRREDPGRARCSARATSCARWSASSRPAASTRTWPAST